KGVFFSSDAGATWKFMGLRDAGQIANIVIDPRDPNIVLVGVLGHAWAPNAERGVFRTTDGGKTWQKVLFVDDETGVSSLDGSGQSHGLVCRPVACAPLSLDAGRRRHQRRHFPFRGWRKHMDQAERWSP